MDDSITVIEFPAIGATYTHEEYGVYKYDIWPRGSVLEGQERRTNLGQYETLAEAQKEHPEAEWHGEGSGYQEITIPSTPPEWLITEQQLADMWYACHIVDHWFGRGSDESSRAWAEYYAAGGTGN